MKTEIRLINDLYDNSKNPPRLLKRGFITRAYVYPQDIMYACEVLNSNGNAYKDRCRIFCKDLGEVICKHSISNIQRITDTKRLFIKGFKRY